MKFRAFAARATVTSSILVLFGVGCGSSGGGGCAALKPLPSANGQPAPAPFGLPPDQVIEGGLQARVTKPGMDKLLGAIVNLVSGGLKSGICIGKNSYGVGCVNAGYCGNGTCGGAPGCTASLILQSADGKDKITASIGEGANPIVHVDAKFDVHVPLDLDYDALFAPPRLVHDRHRLDALQRRVAESARDHRRHSDRHRSRHRRADAQPGRHRARQLRPPVQRQLLQRARHHPQRARRACSTPPSATRSPTSSSTCIKPQINTLLQSFLPKPPGLAGVLDTGTMLASFNPPKDANLEMFVVAGGYVAGKSGGLNLGVMSGVNSDRDQTTRNPGITSEPSLVRAGAADAAARPGAVDVAGEPRAQGLPALAGERVLRHARSGRPDGQLAGRGHRPVAHVPRSGRLPRLQLGHALPRRRRQRAAAAQRGHAVGHRRLARQHHRGSQGAARRWCCARRRRSPSPSAPAT